MSYGRPLVGFGGLSALSTGALAPEVETGLQASLVAVDDLHDLIFNDIRTLADQGVDTSEYVAAADAIATEKSLLWTEIAQIDTAQVPALEQRISDLRAYGDRVQSQIAIARRGAPEQQQLTGLAWGLGALAAAGAVAWFVWDQRRKRRR